MLTFDRLEPDKLLGEIRVLADTERLAQWEVLFPDALAAAADRLPWGLVNALMMRGYVEILGERPKGNVHAEQSLAWGPAVPARADIVISLTCLRKELKWDRRWVWFDSRVCSGAGVVHLQGTMKLLWAA
ncbi:MAG: hypothetical protein JWN85_4967 [Gammaproteobacteria bacterium]|nr:hypothetical protein [Gammaproteobacteria bacterium]